MFKPLDPGDQKTASRLWLVSEVYYPEEISTGYYLTSIAEGIAKNRNVSVLTGQPKHMARGLRAPKRETRNGVDIVRVWCTTFDKNYFVLRLVNMFTVGISMFLRSLALFTPGDKILVCTAPPSLPLTTTAAALLKGSSVTVLVQDSYPEILEAVGTIRKGGVISKVIHLANRWVFKYSSGIVVMGRDMTELFEKKAKGLEPNIFCIPNWADLEDIEPRPRGENRLLKVLGLQDKFVFLYAGNIGHPTDVETIIGAAKDLRDSRSDIHFLFIGAGAKAEWLKNTVKNDSLNNVTVLDYLPRSEQINFLNACDVGLVALVRGMKGTAMPSRTYNLMAAGKPILALTESGSELSMVIEEDGIGWHLEPGAPDRLTDLIVKIVADRHILVELGNNARRAALAKYSMKDAVEKYEVAIFG
jgi:glycosyltransferase involved in cell wall biosynthesis